MSRLVLITLSFIEVGKINVEQPSSVQVQVPAVQFCCLMMFAVCTHKIYGNFEAFSFTPNDIFLPFEFNQKNTEQRQLWLANI